MSLQRPAAHVRRRRPPRRRRGAPHPQRGRRDPGQAGGDLPRQPDRLHRHLPGRRARGELPGEAFGDVFLVVDGWQTLKSEFEQLEQDIPDIAQRGLGFGVHVVITAARWAEIRPQLKDAINTRIELRLGDPMESDVDRKVAQNVPAGVPGRGITRDKLHFLGALPRIDGVEDAADLADGVAKTVTAIAEAWQGPRARSCACCRSWCLTRTCPSPAGAGVRDPARRGREQARAGLPGLQPDPHFLMFGEGESGKTAVLRTIIKGITEITPAPGAHPARRLPAFAARRGPEPSTRSATAPPARRGRCSTVAESSRSWTSASRGRTSPRSSCATALVDRPGDLRRSSTTTTWSPPAAPTRSRRSRSICRWRGPGLPPDHLAAAGGASRALFEPLIQRLRESRQPGLLMSASKDEGPIFGVKPQTLPPGRLPRHPPRRPLARPNRLRCCSSGRCLRQLWR